MLKLINELNVGCNKFITNITKMSKLKILYAPGCCCITNKGLIETKLEKIDNKYNNKINF